MRINEQAFQSVWANSDGAASGSQQSESNAEWVEGAVPSPLAGHAVNPSLGAQLGLSPSRLLLQPP
ncbi:hypothetical protein XPN_4442, partial [Xanthomonas arboricola pv. pruni MAFF 301427]